MIIVGDPINKFLSESISNQFGAELVYPDITIFPDSEQRVRVLADKIKGETVYLVKSFTSPIDTEILRFTFTVDALVRSGADKIIGIVPYFPYSRADHVFKPGEGVPFEIIVKLLESAGLNEIVIVDPHSIKNVEMFKIKVHNLSAASLFAEKIQQILSKSDPNNFSTLNFQLSTLASPFTLVSPDMGGLRRLQEVNELLGGNINTFIINKDRDYDSGELKVAKFEGEIKGKCFIIDDIISTGFTIVQAVDTLIQNGAEEVFVFATHAVLSQNASDLLQNSKISKVFVTDSIPVPSEKKFTKLSILNLASVLAAEKR